MIKQAKDLKILIIQIRDDQTIRDLEMVEFSRFSGLNLDQFTVINVFDTPSFAPNVIENHDALFVGGSSDASGLESVAHPEKYPYAKKLRNLFVHCLEKEIPVFASCYGFEEVATAVGGTLVKDNKNVGKGFATIELTEDGKNDPLFKDMPDEFPAISWHSEKADYLPDNCTLLAKSETCPYLAIKIKNKPFYGFQFHPEIDKQGLIDRLTRYIDRYQSGDVEEMLKKIEQECPEVPEANKLVEKFVKKIILKQ